MAARTHGCMSCNSRMRTIFPHQRQSSGRWSGPWEHEPESPAPAKTGAQACKSMTGYAQARVQHNGWALRISLRSVNHRFLDLHLRLPEGFDAFEPLIRQAVRERLRRGHLDVTLH